MQVGDVVGNYRITGKLGAGGMGAVYLARHTLIGREAAIKVLQPSLCGNETVVARFFNEAKTTTAIKHPGIVEVFDFGYAQDGSAYLVMEKLEGESLGARLDRMGKLPADQALSIARQVSGALYAAHKIGIVHRDLKPDNIYVVPDPDVHGGERAKILDFGIAKLRDKDGFAAAETQDGAVMGAPTYMAPEQCSGARDVDRRADIYALGCILFEMLCGRPPFDGRSYGVVMAQHLRELPPVPSSLEPSVPVEVDALVLRMLEKDPERRFPDAFELLTRFHDLGGLAAPAPPPGSSTMPNVPMDKEQRLSHPTMSGVVSSARRTHALGPRRGNGRGGSSPMESERPLLPPLPVASGTQPESMPAEVLGRQVDSDEGDDTVDTVDRAMSPLADRTEDDVVPLGSMYGDPPTAERLLPAMPPPVFAPAGALTVSAGAGGPVMMAGEARPPRGQPPGPPPPPGSRERNAAGLPPVRPGSELTPSPFGPLPTGPTSRPGTPGEPPFAPPSGSPLAPFGGPMGPGPMGGGPMRPGPMGGGPMGPGPMGGGPMGPGPMDPYGSPLGPPGGGGPMDPYGSPPGPPGGGPMAAPHLPTVGMPAFVSGPDGGPPGMGPPFAPGPPPFAPGPPPPAPPQGPGVMALPPRDFGAMPPDAFAPTMYQDGMGRPVVRRDEVFGQPRPMSSRSRGGKLAGLIIGLALVAGAVAAYVVATNETAEGDEKAAAAKAQPASGAATKPTSTPASKPAATPSAPAQDAGPAQTAAKATDAGAALASADSTPAPEPGAGDPSDDAKSGDAKSGDAKSEDVKTGDAKSDDAKSGDAKSDDAKSEKPEVAKAPEEPKEPKPTGPVTDSETNRRPMALITLQIDSLPRGAQVIRKSDGVRLGETPFRFEIEPQKGSITIVLRHRGYRDEMVVLPGNRSADRRVPLTRTDGPDRAPSLQD